jgi:PPOX class probable F420-dependent enzyme
MTGESHAVSGTSLTGPSPGITVPPEAARHLREDEVAWLVTVTPATVGYPTPVWFVFDGADIVLYTEPDARKVANISRQSRVTLHFNSDPEGSDIVVITGRAVCEPDADPNSDRAYARKYASAMTRLGMTDALMRRSSVRVRIRPISIWLGDASAASDPQ